jgi:ABC-2 type transport system ATP-binding protein
VTENRIAINHQLNSDEFAWKLYNEKVFFSEFYMEEETLEDYFVKALGGGNRG